jgi:hypothetical protein
MYIRCCASIAEQLNWGAHHDGQTHPQRERQAGYRRTADCPAQLLVGNPGVSAPVQQGPLALFAAFLVVHTLADFPPQGTWLAMQKSRKTASGTSEWLVAIWSHSVIHAGGVWLVRGSLALGVVELALHSAINLGKGGGKFGLIADQVLHAACKAGYVVVLTSGWFGPG